MSYVKPILMILLLLAIGGCSQVNKYEMMKKASVDIVLSHPQKGHTAKNIGSGVVVDKTGGHIYVLTAHHVIENVVQGDTSLAIAQRVYNPKINSPNEFIYSDAEIVKVSQKNDLALLKAESNEKFDLVPVMLYKGEELLSMGTDVYHIGSPLSRRRMMSEGIISRYQHFDTVGSVMNVTTIVSPGSSGGPVFDEKGRLIGIVSMMDLGFDSNIGMAIPYFKINKWVEEEKLEHYFE